MQQNLRIPGPTPIPPEVADAMARPMINHRGPEFAAIIARVSEGLQHFFQTTQPVHGFPSSGSGAMEAAICAMSLERGWLPPTLNLEDPDDGCDLDYIPTAGREGSVEYMLKNSFGFGGINAALVLRRV